MTAQYFVCYCNEKIRLSNYGRSVIKWSYVVYRLCAGKTGDSGLYFLKFTFTRLRQVKKRLRWMLSGPRCTAGLTLSCWLRFLSSSSFLRSYYWRQNGEPNCGRSKIKLDSVHLSEENVFWCVTLHVVLFMSVCHCL
jgi:hypothetical protein